MPAKSKRTWAVEATPLAEDDLTYLRRHHRAVRQHVRRKLLPKLQANPKMGEPLKNSLAGVRSIHFWKDRYRLAYVLDESDRQRPRIVVVSVGLKNGFYDTVKQRLAGMGAEDGDSEGSEEEAPSGD